ncbi:MAG: response regulator [Proteobacteria bacterium]|nr:response regulator [Pseudomonadota bacterium]
MFDSITIKPATLIISNESTDRGLLAEKLEEQGFYVLIAENGQVGIEIWAEKMNAIRIVITDLAMVPVDGLEVIKTIRDQQELSTYIVALTAEGVGMQQQNLLHDGPDAWMQKPVQVDQLEALLHSAKLQLRLNDCSDLLAGLAELAAERGGETVGHLQRTKRYCFVIADDLCGQCPALGLTERQVQDIAEISVLHDIGKIGLPDGLLTKRGRYSPKEYEIIKDHTIIGGNLLKKLYQRSGSVYILMGHEMAMTHHEKWAGGGYPLGLQGEEIPLAGRIMAFADVYDALLSRRPYKDPLSLYHAEHAIKEGKGSHFDPLVVESYERNRQRFVEIYNDFKDK